MLITTHFNPNFDYHTLTVSDGEGITTIVLNRDAKVDLSEKWIHNGVIFEVSKLPRRTSFEFYQSNCPSELNLAGIDLVFNQRLNAYHPCDLRGVEQKDGMKYYVPTIADMFDCLKISAHKLEATDENPEIEYNAVEHPHTKASIAISTHQGPDSVPVIIETEDDIEVWHKTVGIELSSYELDKMAKNNILMYGADIRGWLAMHSFEENEIVSITVGDEKEEKCLLVGISYEKLNLVNRTPLAVVELGEGSLEVKELLIQPINSKLAPKLKEVIEGIYSVKYQNYNKGEEETEEQ